MKPAWCATSKLHKLTTTLGWTGPAQHDELGQALINICQVVPKGVVVFCPSYDFMWQIKDRWDRTGATGRLGQRKKVRARLA